jgi:copper oxidase (laccase) domain-containing protein
MTAYLGPCAGACCYEVGGDVAARFDERHVRRSHGKWFADLRAANLAQLLAAGIREEAIEVSTGCTIHDVTTFHSFRRDGSKSGRMLGVIGLKPVR